jgi:hydroxylamine reductase (hybrid-cluster protein)
MWRTEDRIAVVTCVTIRRADHFAAVGTRFEMIGRNTLVTDLACADVALAVILVAVRAIGRMLNTHRCITGCTGAKMLIANRLTAYITLR